MAVRRHLDLQLRESLDQQPSNLRLGQGSLLRNCAEDRAPIHELHLAGRRRGEGDYAKLP